MHCNAKKQGTRRQTACWSGFSSRKATAFYDHLRLSVVSLFFNPQSVNTNHRILPQMIRVEMKHPSGPAESTAGHLAVPVPCLPWHENFRLARQAGSALVPCGGRSDKPLRAASQQRDWLHPVPAPRLPPGARRAACSGPVRTFTAPLLRGASARGGGHRTAPECPRLRALAGIPGRLGAGLGVPQHSPPKTALQERRFPPQERYPNRATPPVQLIFPWRQRLHTLVHVYGFSEPFCRQTDM